MQTQETVKDICNLIEFRAGIKILAKQFNSDSFFGLSLEDINDFHFKMWTFCHGLATLLANDKINLTDEQINILISQEFQALMLLRDNPNNKYIFREEN